MTQNIWHYAVMTLCHLPFTVYWVCHLRFTIATYLAHHSEMDCNTCNIWNGCTEDNQEELLVIHQMEHSASGRLPNKVKHWQCTAHTELCATHDKLHVLLFFFHFDNLHFQSQHKWTIPSLWVLAWPVYMTHLFPISVRLMHETLYIRLAFG